jgi:hypothetical protein
VEQTSLDGGRGNDKEVSVQSCLREGSVVFVRLLQTLASGSNFPVAYQVVDVPRKSGDSRVRVRLEQLGPRPSYKESVSAQ